MPSSAPPRSPVPAASPPAESSGQFAVSILRRVGRQRPDPPFAEVQVAEEERLLQFGSQTTRFIA